MANEDAFTRRFLSNMNLGKYDLAPSENSYHEVKVYKLNQIAEPGDHIAVWRDKRGYWHHGIYCGEDANEDAFVIDLMPEMGVSSRSFDDFIHREDTAIVIDYDDNAFPKEVSLMFAKYAVEYSKECPITYNTVNSNCDKFALMMRTGRWEPSISLPQPKKQHRRPSCSISAKLGLR